MLSFFDLQTELPVGISSFLESVESEFKRRRISQLLEMGFIVIRKLPLLAAPDQLRIVVRKDRVPTAQAISGTMEISTGLIDHCLGQQAARIETVIPEANGPDPLNYELVGLSMMGWVFAHEMTHIGRAHSTALERLGSDSLTCMALEYDADLSAAAAMYRLFQDIDPTSDDLLTRKMVAYCIFWAIRSLPDTIQSSTHAPIQLRLRSIVDKLAGINKKSGQLGDIFFKSPETARNRLELVKLLARCDIGFAELYPTRNLENVVHEFLRNDEDNIYFKIIGRWSEISAVVNAETRAQHKLLGSKK